MRIYTTSDLNIFRIAKNRPLSELHVKRMMKKDISEPIIVDSDMNVLDGQHRLDACRRANKPIRYVLNKTYPILVSLHKAGSTWVNSFIHKKYRHMRGGLVNKATNDFTEYFSIDKTSYFKDIDYEERIALLEKLRTFGLELNHKVHVPEIKKIWPWFKKFYKNNDVIVLRRKNLYKHFLSILFSQCIIRDIPILDVSISMRDENTEQVNEDILKAQILENKVDFSLDLNILNNFFNNIRFLEDVVIPDLKPQVIWLEEIDHEWLEDRFKVKIEYNTVRPYKTLDHEVYFSAETKATIKAAIDKQIEQEFKYYGYK